MKIKYRDVLSTCFGCHLMYDLDIQLQWGGNCYELRCICGSWILGLGYNNAAFLTVDVVSLIIMHTKIINIQ